MKQLNTKTEKRERRVRAKILKNINRPRLTIFRSNRFLYAQIIDDSAGKTICGITSKEVKDNKKRNKQEIVREAGKILAGKALKKNIKAVVFDRGGYKYHGYIKSFAEGAREGGLDF